MTTELSFKKSQTLVICISHHQIPVTGAHVRFDRLVAKLAQKEENIIWISPKRSDFYQYSNIEFLWPGKSSTFLPTKLYMLIHTLQKGSKLIQYRKSVKFVLTFGETNLLSAIMASTLVDSQLSIGVRSNVIKRFIISLEEKNWVHRIASSFRFCLDYILLKVIYFHADQIVVQSSQAKLDFMINFSISENKIFVIENDLPKYCSNSEKYFLSAENRNVLPNKILYIGKATKIKGFDTLLVAIPKIFASIPWLEKITIAGIKKEDLSDYYKSYLSDFSENVEFIPWCHDISRLMKEHDLLVVPSREDQFPNVVLEALASGLPVIGTSVDGIKHMLSESWILFQPGDPDALIECLCRVLTLEGYAKAISIAIQRAQHFNFDWEQRYVDLLNKLTSKS